MANKTISKCGVNVNLNIQVCLDAMFFCVAGRDPISCKHYETFEEVTAENADPAVDISVDEAPVHLPPTDQSANTSDQRVPNDR